MIYPLVSIITPSYQQAAYLEATIQSVLRQDYAQVEYIVVDGGSTDGSLDIIRRYEDQLAYWVSERDSGQAEAINKGFRQARGEIVAWLNSDDLYLPGAVANAVQAFAQAPQVGLVFGNAITIDPAGRPLNRLDFPDWKLDDLAAFRIICQPAVFMRRAMLEQAGYLDERYHLMLDHQLWLRLGALAPIRHVQQTWAAARHHPQAKNLAAAARFGEEIFRILAWMKTDPTLSQLIVDQPDKVQSGAHRLDGRYLLEGGLPWQALQAYGRALRHDPVYTARHWHRIVFALGSLVGLRKLAQPFYQVKQKKNAQLTRELSGLHGWPGLALEESA